MFLTFPLEAYVVRHVMEELWMFICEQRGRPKPEWWLPRHLIITVVIVALAALIAIGIGDNLGKTLSLVGTSCAVAVALVMPAMIYLKVMPGKLLLPHKIPAWIMLVFGVADGLVSTGLIIKDIVLD